MSWECACGATIVGAVLAGRVNVAVALFQEHPPRARVRTALARGAPTVVGGARPAQELRLTPDRIYGSAWWVKDESPSRHGDRGLGRRTLN